MAILVGKDYIQNHIYRKERAEYKMVFIGRKLMHTQLIGRKGLNTKSYE